MLPNLSVAGLVEAEQSNLGGSWKEICQPGAELVTEILIEQQLHTAVSIRDSRSAAKARDARMSSSVSSGKSAMISSCDIPAANHPSTSETAMRIPRMHG